MSITDSQQLWAMYFTYWHTFVWNCAFVRVTKNTHKKKEPMKKTYAPQQKKKKKKKVIKKIK